jgi:hypothetical protein
MDKKFVIAGNKGEFYDYANKPSVSSRELVYVDTPASLHLNGNPHGVFIGTWKSRTDILDILNALEILWNFQNTTIRKIRESLVNASPSPLAVYLNGVLQAPADYTVSGNTVSIYNPTNQIATIELKTSDKMLYSFNAMPYDTLHASLHINIS